MRILLSNLMTGSVLSMLLMALIVLEYYSCTFLQIAATGIMLLVIGVYSTIMKGEGKFAFHSATIMIISFVWSFIVMTLGGLMSYMWVTEFDPILVPMSLVVLAILCLMSMALVSELHGLAQKAKSSLAKS